MPDMQNRTTESNDSLTVTFYIQFTIYFFLKTTQHDITNFKRYNQYDIR